MGYSFQPVRPGGRSPCREIAKKYKLNEPTRNDYFFIDKAGKTSRSFNRKARDSKFLMYGTAKTAKMAEQLERTHAKRVKRGDASEPRPIADLAEAFRNNMVQKAAAWNCVLSDYGALFYGCMCNKEDLVELQPNLKHNAKFMEIVYDPEAVIYLLPSTPIWQLLATKDFETNFKEWGIKENARVKWHCHGCTKQYAAGRDLPQRVIHITKPDAKTAAQRVLVSAFVGYIPDGLAGGRSINAMIGLLKTAKLAAEIGGRKIAYDLILETVHKLCTEAKARLEDYYGEYRVSLRSADWRNGKYWDLVGVCEDTRLSVAAIGTPLSPSSSMQRRCPRLRTRSSRSGWILWPASLSSTKRSARRSQQ
jgi:hypothetical protein